MVSYTRFQPHLPRPVLFLVATHSFCLEGCFYYVRWQREGAGPYAYQVLLDVQAIQ